MVEQPAPVVMCMTVNVEVVCVSACRGCVQDGGGFRLWWLSSQCLQKKHARAHAEVKHVRVRAEDACRMEEASGSGCCMASACRVQGEIATKYGSPPISGNKKDSFFEYSLKYFHTLRRP